MRKAVICNFKGGVGKTTCAINIAVGLARAEKKVLLLDNDSQSNTTTALGIDGNQTAGMYGLIVNGLNPYELMVTVEDKLEIIPSSRALAPVDQWLSMQTRREEILKKRLAGVNGHDFMIIDTAPSFSLLNLNALTLATEAWIPISMEYLALEGTRQVLETLQMIREELNHILLIRYVIPTFYDIRNAKSKSVLETLTENFKEAVTSPIRINVKLSEAPSYHKSIYDYAPTSSGAHDYLELVRRIANEQ